jgi:SAM-dependent methyltransferase
LRLEGEALVCSACSERFDSRSGVPCFLLVHQAERFAIAQAAEEKHHEEAWTALHLTALRGVKSLEDYRDWLESFYRVGLCAFGFSAGYFREKTIIEIGSGPFGMLGCISHSRGVAIDPLMPSFVRYMRPYWGEQPLRVAALGEELPVCSKMFDIAIAINTLDHTLEPEKILKETYRVLKPGGLLLINNNVKSRAGVWFAGIGERFGIERLTEVFHPHAFTKGDLVAGCHLAGFDIIDEFCAKSLEPEESRRQWTWKHSVRNWLENECKLWLLAKKPETGEPAAR